MTVLSLYIAGRRRICQPVNEAALLRGLDAIRDRMPALELQGRVVVTGDDGNVTYIIRVNQ